MYVCLFAFPQVSSAPIVVHCDSGVGRTGVLLGLCVAVQQLRAFGRTDTMDVVRLLRRGRNGMVVTPDECQLLHELIGDYAASLTPSNRQAESRL